MAKFKPDFHGLVRKSPFWSVNGLTDRTGLSRTKSVGGKTLATTDQTDRTVPNGVLSPAKLGSTVWSVWSVGSCWGWFGRCEADVDGVLWSMVKKMNRERR